MDSLKLLCGQYLASKLDHESVTSTFLLADMHQVDELKSKCIEYIATNANKVMVTSGWKSFLTINRMDLMADLFKQIAIKANF